MKKVELKERGYEGVQNAQVKGIGSHGTSWMISFFGGGGERGKRGGGGWKRVE